MKKRLLVLAIVPLLLSCNETKKNVNQPQKYRVKETYNNVSFSVERDTMKFYIEYAIQTGVDPHSGVITYDYLTWSVYLTGYYVVKKYDYSISNTFFVCGGDNYFLINYAL